MIAEVIVDVISSELDRVFDYNIPDNFAYLQSGYRVLVPFGNRKIEGYIIAIKDSSNFDKDKIKDISEVLDDYPLLLPELIELIHYLKNNQYLRIIDGIRLAVPAQVVSSKEKFLKEVLLNDDKVAEFLGSLSKRQKNAPLVIKYLQDRAVEKYTTLAKLFGGNVINKMLDIGVLTEKSKRINRLQTEIIKTTTLELTDLQKTAVKNIMASKEKPILVHGVTGSGKTEVYLSVIENALKDGKTALILVPEISLTPQMVRIFSSRFGEDVAVIHSALSSGEKHDEWMRIYRKEAKIVVGARSAIFSPLQDIGVIIIDEEHDGSYLSDSNPRYFTHDIAKFRQKYNSSLLIFGSATPSVESFYQTTIGTYNLTSLPIRINRKPMPKIEIVDMATEFRLGNNTPLSSMLMEKLSSTIAEGNQAILFLNRRGFSAYLMCRECSHIPKCTSCDVNLVYHKSEGVLKCHYCGKKFKGLTNCPECKSESIKLGSFGTQQVAEFVREKFPNVPVFRLDNDSVTNKNSYSKILQEFSKAKPSVLVGTQMVTKGHDFPLVTLVGLVDADVSLFNYSYKASETTFSLVTQVSGRAGRGEFAGEVVLQTFVPKNSVYLTSANYDYQSFYNKEINLRETTKFPPFATIVRILCSSEEDDVVKDYTHKLILKLKSFRVEYSNEFYFLEGMKSPINKIKNKHRYQIVMRFNNKISEEIVKKIYNNLDENKQKKVSVFVEINPQSLS